MSDFSGGKISAHVCIADRIYNYVQASLNNFLVYKPVLHNYKVEYEWVKLDVSSGAFKMATRICNELRGDLIINGKNPKTVSAGIVLFILSHGTEYVTMKQVADNFKISTGTVSKWYYIIRDLVENLKEVNKIDLTKPQELY